MRNLVYLASPYSHPDPEVMEERFLAACRACGHFMRQGVNCYSPIAHSHSVAQVSDLPVTWDYWERVDRDYLAVSKAVYVLALDGWERSTGVTAEIEIAKEAGTPVYLVHPGDYSLTTLWALHKPERPRLLLALCGFAQSGKDALASFLVENHGFTRIAFADPLREMAEACNPIVAPGYRYADVLAIHGYDEAKQKYPEVRAFLQRLGTEAGRQVLGENVWVDAAMERVDACEGPVCIADCRFHNEAEAVRARGGHVVLVQRPGVSAVNGHVSEALAAELAETSGFDYWVHNDGTLDDLAHKARWMVHELAQAAALEVPA